jgi:hypothetical protein
VPGLVGTFYRAGEPGSTRFVEVGDVVACRSPVEFDQPRRDMRISPVTAGDRAGHTHTTAGLLAGVIRHPSFLAAEHDITTLESIIAESRTSR